MTLWTKVSRSDLDDVRYDIPARPVPGTCLCHIGQPAILCGKNP
jgi:hypothetical protein